MNKFNILKLDDYSIDKIIKIKGTQFDRRIKLDKNKVKLINKLYKSGYSIAELSRLFDVCYATIKYHVDSNEKERVSMSYYYYGYGSKYSSKELKEKALERGRYKRSLLQSGDIKVNTVLVVG